MEGVESWIAVVPPSGALVAVLVYLIRSVRSGDWVPRHTVEFMRSLLEERAAAIALERDKALELAERERGINETQAVQLASVAEGQETVLHLIRALPAALADPAPRVDRAADQEGS